MQLSVKTESDIREMFVHHDTDQSGSIDVRELHMVFAAFNGARFDVRMSAVSRNQCLTHLPTRGQQCI